MKWAKKLLFGEQAGKKRTSYLWKLKRGKGVPGLSAIVLSETSPNQFDIIDTGLLMWKKYPKEDLILVGIAKGQDEAMEVISRLSEEVFKETGTADMKSYVMEHNI